MNVTKSIIQVARQVGKTAFLTASWERFLAARSLKTPQIDPQSIFLDPPELGSINRKQGDENAI